MEGPKIQSSGLTPEEFRRQQRLKQAKAAAEQKTPPNAPRATAIPSPSRPDFKSVPTSADSKEDVRGAQKVDRQRNPLSTRAKRFLGLTAAVVVLGGGGLIVHAADPGILESITHPNGATIEEANTPNTTTLKSVGLTALNCGPSNESIVSATVNGYLPMYPEEINAKGVVVRVASPYLTKKQVASLPESEQAAAAKFITSDGFPHFDVQNLELALNVCDTGSDIIETTKGKAVESFQLDNAATGIIASFSDPNMEFGLNLSQLPVEPQVGTANLTNLNPSQLQYFTTPATVSLGMSIDATNQPLFAPLEKAMANPAQYKALEAVAEEDIVELLGHSANGQNNISFIGGNDLTHMTDSALLKELESNPNVTLHAAGTFDFKANVPVNADKTLLSSKDVVGLSLGKFHITSAKVVEGTEVNPYKPIATPAPTPTPSNATPTPSPTPKKK